MYYRFKEFVCVCQKKNTVLIVLIFTAYNFRGKRFHVRTDMLQQKRKIFSRTVYTCFFVNRVFIAAQSVTVRYFLRLCLIFLKWLVVRYVEIKYSTFKNLKL